MPSLNQVPESIQTLEIIIDNKYCDMSHLKIKFKEKIVKIKNLAIII
jgi:hypothetical protein